jgi:hypothetical protein
VGDLFAVVDVGLDLVEDCFECGAALDVKSYLTCRLVFLCFFGLVATQGR